LADSRGHIGGRTRLTGSAGSRLEICQPTAIADADPAEWRSVTRFEGGPAFGLRAATARARGVSFIYVHGKRNFCHCDEWAPRRGGQLSLVELIAASLPHPPQLSLVGASSKRPPSQEAPHWPRADKRSLPSAHSAQPAQLLSPLDESLQINSGLQACSLARGRPASLCCWLVSLLLLLLLILHMSGRTKLGAREREQASKPAGRPAQGSGWRTCAAYRPTWPRPWQARYLSTWRRFRRAGWLAGRPVCSINLVFDRRARISRAAAGWLGAEREGPVAEWAGRVGLRSAPRARAHKQCDPFEVCL